MNLFIIIVNKLWINYELIDVIWKKCWKNVNFFYVYLFSLYLCKEWVYLFLFHDEFYIRTPIFILKDLKWIEFFEKKSWMFLISRDFFFFLLIIEWRFIVYLLMTSEFIKRNWRVSLLRSLILWVRSQSDDSPSCLSYRFEWQEVLHNS